MCLVGSCRKCQESAIYAQTLSTPLIGRLAGELALPKAGCVVPVSPRSPQPQSVIAAGNGVVLARRQLGSEKLRRGCELLCEAQDEATHLNAVAVGRWGKMGKGFRATRRTAPLCTVRF